MRFAGEWVAPTIEGPRSLVVSGRQFQIPEAAEVKVVTGHRGSEFAHVRYGVDGVRRVAVLSAAGQLHESDADAILRGTPTQWGAVIHG